MRYICFTLFLSILFVGSVMAQEERPQGWTDASHGNRAEVNYEVVLPDDRVNELFIVFRPEEWATEIADMTATYGERGTRRDGGQPGAPPGAELFNIDMDSLDLAAIAEEVGVELETLAAALGYWPNIPAVLARLGSVDLMQLAMAVGFGPEGGPAGAPGGRDGRGGEGFSFGRNPIWVAADVHFAGQIWWEVGFRFKGNSSLSSSWADGRVGLPFKLDLDEFEDDYPALDNQRFYGFKQLSFSNNWSDPSLQREKAAADIFRDVGLAASETAFYAVYVDDGSGAGSVFWGIFTASELPDDTLIETQFSDDGGNMYKPDGNGASFAAGSFDEASFDKETNRNSGYEDIETLFAALHTETRASDPATWRAGLEEVFAVDVFLRWLATNQLIQNWDSYGIIAHNYYLYADLATGQLTWIPWDHNHSLRERLDFEVMGDRREVVAGRRVVRVDIEAMGHRLGRSALMALSNFGVALSNFGVAQSIGLEEVDESWPLIHFLLDDEVYGARYRKLVAEIASQVFNAERMGAIYEANHDLIAGYLSEAAAASVAELAALRAATAELVAHVAGREAAAAEFMAETAAENGAN